MVGTDIKAQVDSDNMELMAEIQQDGFAVDWQVASGTSGNGQVPIQEDLYGRFRDDPNRALLYLGFSDHDISLSDSLRFLRCIAVAFVTSLSKNPDIELLREKIVVEMDDEEVARILHNAPYMNGADHLNRQWIEHVWRKLNHVVAHELAMHEGSIADYLTAHNRGIHVVGRVFFHLVENKADEYPFAFLATYASRAITGGKSKHLPLKSALVEYKDDREKLLELLSTVNCIFRNKPATCSGKFQPLNSLNSSHLFRLIPATHSGK